MSNVVNKLLWLAFFVSVAAANGLKDMPPANLTIIASIGNPGNKNLLKDPQDFVITGDTSDNPSRKNKLNCSAENADQVLWQYRKEKDGVWGDVMPPMELGPQNSIGGGKVSREISDGDATEIEQLSKLNGYYRCVAKLTSKGYETQSPPVRIVITSIEIGLVPPIIPTDLPGINLPTENQPYTLPCKTGETHLDPLDAADFTDVTYSWVLTEGTSPRTYPEEDANAPNRVRMDPKTGDLTFAYVKSADGFMDTGESGGDLRLRCFATMGSRINVEMGDYSQLSVTANDDPVEDVGVLYPETEMVGGDLTVKERFSPSCIAGTECEVVIMFSGLYAANGTVMGRAPDGTEHLGGDYPGFKFTAKASEDSQVVYMAILLDKVTKVQRLSVKVPIIIKAYPKLSPNAIFPGVQYVTTGKNVKLICDADYARGDDTEFYINGAKATQGNPPYVTRTVGNTLEVNNIQRTDSFSVQCVAKNEVGALYVNSIVNVYDVPVLANSPEDGHLILEGNASTEYTFTCTRIIDHDKVTEEDFYFRTNMSSYNDPPRKVEFDESSDLSVIKSSGRSFINETTKKIELTVDLKPNTQDLLSGTNWWCVFNYTVLDDPTYRVMETPSMPIRFEKPPLPPQEQKPPFKYYPVIFGAIGGLLFLILIVVLINCYVQKNKGEQYYVDEKERKAGHNPAEEMEAYGFADYTRPDQNPIKGSRASMNISDKPMESDTGSLDEYGVDMDPSRYNEDGSFIGQYGQNGQPSRNQADV